MLRHTALVLFIVAVTAGASAQESTPEASHRAAAEELLTTIDIPTVLNEAIRVSLDAELEMQPEIAPYRDLMEAFFKKHMSWAALRLSLIDIYVRNFTEGELREMTAFYRTPTGQKAARLTPTLMEEGMLLGQQAVEANLHHLERAVMDRALKTYGN
ncbi:MAG: DUF2059 domain-containing protein [Bacteroidota bacterium]